MLIDINGNCFCRNFEQNYDRQRSGFKSLDVITVIFDHGKLSFLVNGFNKGEAYRNVSGRFYPAATIYSPGDSVTITGDFEHLIF